ncbi:zinc ribbon domain-containing protein [Halorubrum sp. RMP-47]|uniref:Zinc ribbon domain-containing protein n=1 Tax=Halorubrum miltondacostae TaxID=3076378 RepID=A0ABD5M0A9_9EURY
MTGDQLLPLAAIFVGVAAINLAVTWLLVRRNRDPAELFGSVATQSSDADGDGEVGPALAIDRDPGPDEADEADDGDGPPPLDADNGDGPPPLDADGETVVCRHCGAENRAGYRYCRWCAQSGFVDGEGGVTAGTAMADRSL